LYSVVHVAKYRLDIDILFDEQKEDFALQMLLVDNDNSEIQSVIDEGIKRTGSARRCLQ